MIAVSLRRAAHMSAVPVRFAGVDRRAALEQHVHGVRIAGAHGGHQQRVARCVGRLDVCAGVEQAPQDRGMALFGGHIDRRDTKRVGDGRVRTGAKQRIDRVEVFGAHGPVQRRRTIGRARVDVVPLPQQRADCRHVAGGGGADKRIVSGGGVRREEQQECGRPDQKPGHWSHISVTYCYSSWGRRPANSEQELATPVTRTLKFRHRAITQRLPEETRFSRPVIEDIGPSAGAVNSAIAIYISRP